MRKIILTIILALGTITVNAQETAVQIKVENKKAGNYWIEVADRNCGAQSNGINSYGKHYSWSMGSKASERKVADVAGRACTEFVGGGHSDWRLPVIEEVWALMHKCIPGAVYATLKSERGDTEVYFPYAGMIDPDTTEPIMVDKGGYFWSAYGSGGSETAVVLEFSDGFANNPTLSKKGQASVRCVRNAQ